MLQNQFVELDISFYKNKKCAENWLKLYEIICDKNSVHIKAGMKFKNYTENNTTDNVFGDHLPYKLIVLLRYNVYFLIYGTAKYSNHGVYRTKNPSMTYSNYKNFKRLAYEWTRSY